MEAKDGSSDGIESGQHDGLISMIFCYYLSYEVQISSVYLILFSIGFVLILFTSLGIIYSLQLLFIFIFSVSRFLLSQVVIQFYSYKQIGKICWIFMIKTAKDQHQAMILKNKRREILRKDSISQNHKNKRSKSQQCSKDLISCKRLDPRQNIQEKNQDINKLKSLIQELILRNKELHENNIELIEKSRTIKANQLRNNRNLDQEFLGFSFKAESKDYSAKKNNSSYENNMGLQSTEIFPNSNKQSYFDQINLKGSYNIRNMENGGTKATNLLKIPEEPERKIKQVKSHQCLKSITKKKVDQDMLTLKKKIRKLQSKYDSLTKECAYWKSACKNTKSVVMDYKVAERETLDSKIRGYQTLIEKQQMHIQNLITRCEEQIQEKDKEIVKLTSAYLYCKNSLQEKTKIRTSTQIRQYQHQIRELIFQNEALIQQNETLSENLVRKEMIIVKLQNQMKGQTSRGITAQRSMGYKKIKESQNQSFSSMGSKNILVVNGQQYSGESGAMFSTEL